MLLKKNKFIKNILRFRVWFPNEALNFAKVMKHRIPSKWVKVDRFQSLSHFQILRTLNFKNLKFLLGQNSKKTKFGALQQMAYL